ncbi:MAG: tetratricopeptide repeat protein [Sedimentisphaerales bacterium]|nr:tetratricopeptide repeat protein [Sedimentisphaerales bacterium]
MKWSFSLVFVFTIIFLIKPLLVNQLVKRAEAYTAYNFHEDAVRQYQKAVLIDRKNSNIWNSLGNSYKNLGTLPDAIDAYNIAIETNPVNRAALFNLGMIFMLKKDYAHAMPYFEKVAALGPEDAEYKKLYQFSHHKLSMEMLDLCRTRQKQNK